MAGNNNANGILAAGGADGAAGVGFADGAGNITVGDGGAKGNFGNLLPDGALKICALESIANIKALALAAKILFKLANHQGAGGRRMGNGLRGLVGDKIHIHQAIIVIEFNADVANLAVYNSAHG